MAQLSLFEAAPSCGSGTIRPGDWVKLRKKSVSAPHTKRGDTFQVDTVHPIDGSIRIWNPNTEEWGFLYPDEVSLVPTPVDSVSPELDTESIPPVDSVSPELDTESIPSVDSVSPELDTESIPSVDSVSKAISTYRPKGTARSGEYFRFSYRSGKKMKHVHIPGGNTDSALANARCEEIREALALGISSEAIAEALRDRSVIILF